MFITTEAAWCSILSVINLQDSPCNKTWDNSSYLISPVCMYSQTPGLISHTCFPSLLFCLQMSSRSFELAADIFGISYCMLLSYPNWFPLQRHLCEKIDIYFIINIHTYMYMLYYFYGIYFFLSFYLNWITYACFNNPYVVETDIMSTFMFN